MARTTMEVLKIEGMILKSFTENSKTLAELFNKNDAIVKTIKKPKTFKRITEKYFFDLYPEHSKFLTAIDPESNDHYSKVLVDDLHFKIFYPEN